MRGFLVVVAGPLPLQSILAPIPSLQWIYQYHPGVVRRRNAGVYLRLLMFLKKQAKKKNRNSHHLLHCYFRLPSSIPLYRTLHIEIWCKLKVSCWRMLPLIEMEIPLLWFWFALHFVNSCQDRFFFFFAAFPWEDLLFIFLLFPFFVLRDFFDFNHHFPL